MNAEWNRPYDVLLQEGEWQTLPALPTPSWDEREQKSIQGSSYDQTIRVRTQQLSRGASGVMNAISRRRLLLRITDNEGQQWILGNTEEAFQMSYQRTGGGGGSFAGYTVTFTGSTSHSTTAFNPFLP